MSIKIDLKIFLFAILFWFTKQIKFYAILMIFAFVHEMGHLICGIILGLKPNNIKICPVGFQILFKTKIEDYNNKNYNKRGIKLGIKKMIIAFAGPLTNIFIILICYIIPHDLILNKETIIYANLLIAIFNLLPIYPLDGGRILKEISIIKYGRKEAYHKVNIISKITVIILTILTSIVILYIHNIALIIILAYLWYLIFQNEKIYKIKEKIYSQLQS